MQLYRPRSKTAHRALQALSQLFAVLCRCRVAGASSYTAPPASRRTLYSSAQPPYYNKVYKRGGGSGVPLLWIHTRQCSISQTMPARRGQLLPPVDRWQVLTRCQQYRPGAPAEGSASPPVQGHPGGWRSGTGQQSGRTGWHNPPGGAVQQQGRGGRRGTIGGSRRIYFRAFAR